MKYIIETSVSLDSLIQEVDLKLGNVEVKGESVANLFTARVILKDIFSNMRLVEEKKELEEIKNE